MKTLSEKKIDGLRVVFVEKAVRQGVRDLSCMKLKREKGESKEDFRDRFRKANLLKRTGQEGRTVTALISSGGKYFATRPVVTWGKGDLDLARAEVLAKKAIAGRVAGAFPAHVVEHEAPKAAA